MGVTIGATGVGSVTLGGTPLAAIHVGTTQIWPKFGIWQGAVSVVVGRSSVGLINENGSGFPLGIVNGTVIRMVYSDSPDFASPFINTNPDVWSKDANQIVTSIDGWDSIYHIGVRDGYAIVYYE